MVSSSQSIIEDTGLFDYLHQVDRTLQSLDLDLDDQDSSAVANLKQTLTQIEVAKIKQTAITQGIWDFYPTTEAIIQKMVALAQIQPHHHVLEPSAGSGDLAQAIALFINQIVTSGRKDEQTKSRRYHAG